MLENTQEIRTIPTTSHPAQKRGPWYLLTGLVLGLILGLFYAWMINPVIYESSSPASLGNAEKDFYRSTIAQVYAVTGNLNRASMRLIVLEDPDPVFALGAQAQRVLADGQEAEARALALLASGLQSSQPQPEMSIEPSLMTATSAPLGVPTHTLPVPTTTP